ncbi:MAG: redoxin domain-containing protein [Prevotella sp.]|nr:redoxin domain-containing protein [Prevotella sp.]
MRKRISIFCLLMGVTVLAMAAPVKYIVNGFGLKAYNGQMFKVRPLAMGEGHDIDSAVVRNGRLIMTGSLPAPRLCAIYAANQQLNLRANIVLGDDGRTTVTTLKGNLIVKGGHRQDLFTTYRRQLALSGIPSRNLLNKKYAEYQDDKTSDKRRAELKKDIETAQERQQSFDKNFILEHCDNVVGAYYFAQNYSYFTKDEMEQLYKRMTDEFRNDPLAARSLETLKAAERRNPGQKYTDFELADSTGTLHRLSDFVGEGHYVLLDFWASWCGPCRAEMPNVKALYEKYHDRGFEVVGVSLDSKRESWLKAIAGMGLRWHQLSDLRGWDCAASNLYGVESIPCTLLIGPDGMIIAQNLRGEELGKQLSDLLDGAK